MRVVIALCRNEKTTIFNLILNFIDNFLNLITTRMLKICF